MNIEPKQLKAFLLDAKLVKKQDFDKALKSAKKENKEVGEVLVSQKLISKDDLARTKAYLLGIPFVNLEREKINPEILKIIPEPIARSYNIVAFRKKDNSLEVAMLDPKDIETIDFIRKKANLKILPRLTNSKSIQQVLKQYKESLRAEFGDIIKKGKFSGLKTKKLEETAFEAPIIKIVDALIKHAISDRASDIHVETSKKEVIIRYRIDGILHDAMTLPGSLGVGIVARIKILSSLKLDERRLPQDGRFKFENELASPGEAGGKYKYSIRVSILPTFKGEKVVMRLLSETTKAFSLEELGLRDRGLEDIQLNLRKPTGMILIAGPTGCGKTTTLYSMLELLNTPEINISTVEDPIEYQIPRINQVQINSKIGLTFASGLRALVRQDPDVIMVGEIRDNETASLSINAALTGHLVLSTLHTTSAAGAIPRLIDMKTEPFLLSSTLNVILAQRLVRRLYEGKERYKLNKEQVKELRKYCDLKRILNILKEEKLVKPNQGIEDIYFYHPKPSKGCPDGYKGRIGIFEVLPVTESIKKLIVKEVASDKIQERAQKEGMRTMIEDGFIKAVQGLTTIEEVLRVTVE